MNPYTNITFLQRLIRLISEYIMQPDDSNAGKLYVAAITELGKDASPKDLVDDDVACAESVTSIIRTLWPDVPIITGTYTLWEYLRYSPKFVKVPEPSLGCIIISPTGTGNGKIRGHVGIVGKDSIVMSNDSDTGLWMEFYTIESWKRKYNGVGGFPVYFYRPV